MEGVSVNAESEVKTRAARVFTSEDFEHLESIRGLAALYVVLNHSRGLLWCGFSYLRQHGIVLPWWQKIGAYANLATSLGHEAVILFFILSGFSIAYSVSKSAVYGRFVTRRLARLYPPYVAGIAYAAAVAWLTSSLVPALTQVGDQTPLIHVLSGPNVRLLGWHEDLMILLYVERTTLSPQNWSLIHEWYFYTAAPALLRWPRIFLGSTVAAVLLVLAARVDVTKWTFEEFVFHYAVFFAAGVMLFHHYDFVARGLVRFRRRGLLLIVLLLGIVLLALRSGRDFTLLTEVLASAMGMALLVLFLEFDPRVHWLRGLGEISYTLYVTHYATIALIAFVIARWTGSWDPPTNPYLWPLGAAASTVFAYPLYFAAERPSKRWLAKKRRERA